MGGRSTISYISFDCGESLDMQVHAEHSSFEFRKSVNCSQYITLEAADDHLEHWFVVVCAVPLPCTVRR